MKTTLKYGFKFLYKAEFSNGLIEHELDHVFFGLNSFGDDLDFIAIPKINETSTNIGGLATLLI